MVASISEIRVHTHCNDLGGKIWNPAIRWTKKYAVFVSVGDGTGQIGVGECWCFDTAPDALVAFLRTEVVAHFLGEPLDSVPKIAAALFARATLTARHGILASALSGIDIATWDLRAKRAEKPLWQALTQAGPGCAHLYASGGLYGEGKSVGDLCREMSGLADRGFGLLKMKVGALSPDEDIARVRAVLQAVPDEVTLIIDGVYSYDSDAALHLFEALPAERIEAFQSPTKAWDLDGMTRLTKAGVPVMATEAEYRPELLDRLIGDARIAFLQSAPVAVGGLSQIAVLAGKVSGTPTRLSLEVSSTAIALMAAVHAAAAYHQIAHVEYHTIHTVFFDRLRLEQCKVQPFEVIPPNQAGLGMSLPENNVPVAFEETSASPQDAA